MKITCLQENLARGLAIVGRAVTTRSTLPVLGNVMVATENGRLKLSATNLEIGVICWVAAKIDEDGATTVPARIFNDLINALPQDEVSMALNSQTETLHLVCAKTEANLKGIDAQEFPLLPEAAEDRQIPIKVGMLREMITQVAFAAAVDDARPTLTGVATDINGNTIKMAATDGFRLSVRSNEFEGKVDKPISIIIPAKALAELARVMGSDDEELVYLSLPEGRNQIIFSLKDVVVISQLIDGKFPDFSPIIPKGYKTRTVMSTADFRKACKTASIFAREASHTARIVVEPGNEIKPGAAVIRANSAEMGDNMAEVGATVDGDQIEIAFNVKFMSDLLAIMDTPQVALETTVATEPGVLKPVGKGDFLHIIMPMHFTR